MFVIRLLRTNLHQSLVTLTIATAITIRKYAIDRFRLIAEVEIATPPGSASYPVLDGFGRRRTSYINASA